MYRAVTLECIALATIPTTLSMSEAKFKELVNEVCSLPALVDCTLAPGFARPTRKRKATSVFTFPELVKPAVAAPPASPLSGTNTGETDDGEETDEGAFACTHVYRNNRRCLRKFGTQQALANHVKEQHPRPKSRAGLRGNKSRVPTNKLQVASSTLHTLPLPLAMPPYLAMTAEVGQVGVKRKEIREDSEWIRSRLLDKASGTPRRIDRVKIFGGVNYCSDKEHWTLFECLGHNLAGAPGETYRYIVPPGQHSEGMEIKVKGLVREIHLGRVIARHIPATSQVLLNGSGKLGLPVKPLPDPAGPVDMTKAVASAVSAAVKEALRNNPKPPPPATPPAPAAINMTDYVSKQFATDMADKMLEMAKLINPRSSNANTLTPTSPTSPKKSRGITPELLNSFMLASSGKLNNSLS